MNVATQLRIEGFWGQIFGPSAESHGVTVVTHGPQLASYPGIYAVLRHGNVLISAPPDSIESVRAWSISPTSVMDPQWWGELLPHWSVLGPSTHSFVGPHEHRPIVNASDPASPAEIHDALSVRVTPMEWVESGFAGDVEHAWLLRDDAGKPVAASNLSQFDGVAADVGVLVAKDARRHGYATAAASAAVEHAVHHHGIARWRSLVSNAASRAVAARLGFEDDCRQLAARPD